MSFYIYILFLILLLLRKTTSTTSNNNKQLVIQKRGVKVNPTAIGLLMYVEVNNTSNEDFEVKVTSEECCVGEFGDRDCRSVEIVGDCVETMPRGTTKTIKLVAPLINPFGRHGYCILNLDSKPKNRDRAAMRDTVYIHFDTRLKNSEKLAENITICSNIDEDPFNDCKPVDCETYYNGYKPYYDKKTKRYTKVPDCISDNDKEDNIPNAIYDPTRNKCLKGKFISENDVNLIKRLTRKRRKAKDVIFSKNDKHHKPVTYINARKTGNNHSTNKNLAKISQITEKGYIIPFDKTKLDQIKDYIITNEYTMMFFGGVILVQSCFVWTMIYCMKNTCLGDKKKKLEQKFFNYRQDASVTTPLIGTSDVETETTDYQDLSEPSNADKKKCYKSCQKEEQNVKISMSDDILTKCINRRSWNSRPAKPEIGIEACLDDDINRRDLLQSIVNDRKNSNDASNQCKESVHKIEDSRKIIAKVNFESEKLNSAKEKKQSQMVRNVVKRNDSKPNWKDNYDFQTESSEKEIKCVSYNKIEGNSNGTELKPTSDNNKLGFSKTNRSKKSVSEGRSVQASFSKDSIDDYLNERGLLYLAEDISKYSFASRSTDELSLSANVLSNTSNPKKNRKVLSLLQRSKKGLKSDPVIKKDSNLGLELIHMSKDTIYSSNNDTVN